MSAAKSKSEGGSFTSGKFIPNEKEGLLHLVEAIETDTNQNTSRPVLKLNEESLQTVLKSSEGRKLSVIAVIRSHVCRKGTILNTIRNALVYKEHKMETFQKTNRTELLYDFELFDTEYQQPRIGIWIWSRAFLLHESDKAVILLDAQGICESEAYSAIFGLSFLSSSILIYNIDVDSFDTAHLTALSTYFKYGFKLLKEDYEVLEKEPPFQTLLFLFSGSTENKMYPYGRDGGSAILKEKTATVGDKLRMDTEDGLKCFQNVISFFAPQMDAVKLGLNNALSELNRPLEMFMADLLVDQFLFPKKVFGKELSPKDFVNYVIHYVQMHNDILQSKQKCIEEDLILETSCIIFHKNIVNRCLQKYEEIFEMQNRKENAKNHDDVRRLHDIAKRLAYNKFKTERKLLRYDKICKEEFETALLSLLENRLAETTYNRSRYGKECFENVTDNFKLELLKTNTFSSTSPGQLKQAVISKLPGDFSGDDGENTLQLVSEIGKPLENFGNTIRKRKTVENDGRLAVAKQLIHDLRTQLAQEYQREMYAMVNDSSAPPSRSSILTFHNLCITKIMATFNDIAKGNPYQQHMGNELENSIQRIYFAIQEKIVPKIMHHEKKEVQPFRNGAQNAQYQSPYPTKNAEMKSPNKDNRPCLFPRGSLDLREFKFRNHTSPTSYNAKSSSMIAPKVNSIDGIIDTCLQDYKSDMSILCRGSTFIALHQLLITHNKSLHKALSLFEELSKSLRDSIPEETKSHFSHTLEAEFAKIKADNNRLMELAKATTKNWKREGLMEYERQMKEIADSCTDVKFYQEAHMKTKQAVLIGLSEKREYNCNNTLHQKAHQQLEDDMEATFVELEDLFRIRLSSDVASTEEIISQARKYYHKEMTQQLPRIHIPPQELEVFHKRIAEAAVENINPDEVRTNNQKLILREWLEASYQKYKDENSMKKNYSEGVEPAIGIDLGTTYCCAGVFMNGQIKIIRNQQGKHTSPSFVTINKNGEPHLVGRPSKKAAYRNIGNTIFDSKRILGRRFEDAQLQNDIEYWPFNIIKGNEGPIIEVDGLEYPPELVSSFILRRLVDDAELFLGCTVRKAVITVPAYFNDGQRQATIDAGEMAGLEVLTILNEPTAASIAYMLERFQENARHALIFDLGGGTFDVAIVKTDNTSIQILAVNGDTHLGGEDFDKTLANYCAKQFEAQYKFNPIKEIQSDSQETKNAVKQRLSRLQRNCESGKKVLSFTPVTNITIDSFAGGKSLEVMVTRSTFEKLVANHLETALNIVKRVIYEANISKDCIDDIVLVGGSTRIPKVKEMLSEFFNGKALNCTINPEEAVAYGAAVKAALMNGEEARKVFKLNSIQDVTPMSLGLEAWANGVPGQFSPIIPKSSKIPVKVDKTYNTLLDNQNSVMIKIYQGEYSLAKDNEFLGEFSLHGIPPAKAGQECVKVSMHIYDTGVLHVSAISIGDTSKRSESLVVQENKGRLSSVTKEKLLNDAMIADVGVFRRTNRQSTKL